MSIILVTGAPRSGTTFVGKIIGASRGSNYVWEPFNRNFRAGIPDYYPYIGPDSPADKIEQYVQLTEGLINLQNLAAVKKYRPDDHGLKRALKKMGLNRTWLSYRLATVRHRLGMSRRLVIKDPIAIFLSRFLIKTCKCKIVVCVRHPAAVAKSREKLGWVVNLEAWKAQPDLWDEYILKQIGPPPENRDPLALSAWHWKTCYTHLPGLYNDWPENLMFVRHEDLCLEPMAEFRRIFDFLELPWTEKTENAIQRHTSGKEPEGNIPVSVVKSRDARQLVFAWKQRVAQADLDRIRTDTQPMSDFFYKEDMFWSRAESVGLSSNFDINNISDNSPLVSAVICSHNGHKRIGKAIQSVLDQTFTDLELIVVDDGSNETMAPVIDKFQDERVRFFRLEYNRGLHAARAFAVQQTAGEFVALLDDDDYWLPEKTIRQIKLIQTDARIGMVCCAAIDVYPDGTQLRRYPPSEIITYRQEAVYENTIASSVIFRKTAYEESGGFDGSLRRCGDWECWIRMARKHEIRALMTPLVMTQMRIDSLQRSDDISLFSNDRFKILEKHKKQLKLDGLWPLALSWQYHSVGVRNFKQGQLREARKLFTKSLRNKAQMASLGYYVLSWPLTKKFYEILKIKFRSYKRARRKGD